MPKDKKISPVPAKQASSATAPFEIMRRSMDEMMGRMFREWPAFDPFVPTVSQASGFALPSMDLSETDKAYEMKLDLPGMDEKNVEVSLDGDVLQISAERSEEKEEAKKTYHLTERRHGRMRRTLRLPANVDPDKITARFDKGVLTVELPKGKTHDSARKIAVKAT